MRIINKKYLVIILLVGVILTSVIVIKPKENFKLDIVILKQEANNKTMAMYVGKDNNYEEYNGNTFPKGYRLNLNKSRCVDKAGIEIENALYTQDNKVGVKSNKSFYCYLYFDEKENLSNICNGSTMEDCMSNSDKLNKIKTIENLSSETKGGMYRYQGQAIDVDNNYICFGTSNKDTCVNDKDHYMYRIIGIEESGRIKVIKKEALDENISWWNDSTIDIKWPQSNIFQAIIGDKFLTNDDYVPITNDNDVQTDWEDKIANNTWLYGDVFFGDKNYNGQDFYEIETGQKEAEWVPGKDENLVSRKWTDTIQSKVSLMYISDYLISISDIAICNLYGLSDENCKTGWIHLTNNDQNSPRLGYEYVMDRSGYDISYKMFTSINIDPQGTMGRPGLNHAPSIRPTFYIIDNISLSGLGTIDNPYIIH